MNTFEKCIERLVEKASEGDKDEAMRYSQAALNVAHAAQVIQQTSKTNEK